MPHLSDPAIAAQNAAARAVQNNLKPKPEDIDSDWMDSMVTRLFNELGRQMKQVEDSRTACNDASGRAANARTLASLENTMEKLARVERERTAQRTSKAAQHESSAIEAIERKISSILKIEFDDGRHNTRSARTHPK